MDKNDLIENKLNLELPKRVNTEEEIKEVMELYKEIAEVFIRHKTKINTSFIVLSAMADAIFTWIAQGND